MKKTSTKKIVQRAKARDFYQKHREIWGIEESAKLAAKELKMPVEDLKKLIRL